MSAKLYTFIVQHNITCPEACYEDRVYENAPELIEEIGHIIGWFEYPEDE